MSAHFSVQSPRQWLVTPSAPSEFLASFPELPTLVAHLLYHRGLRTQEEVDAFFNPDYGDDLHDPFLFRDMEKAVARIFTARDQGELTLVHGDYDADGVCGAVILLETLKGIGCTADVFIPHREKDGYGFNLPAVVYARQKDARLIVTCDCGISNAGTVTEAKAAGIDVIITDHHLIPTDEKSGEPVWPPALAIIHPKVPNETYPYHHLTGGGAAFKLCQAIAKRDAESKNPRLASGFEKWLLDCAAISTIADYGPLIGENRVLVTYGLIVLQKTRRVGLRALYETAGINPVKINPTTVGFQIAPRINAAGRIDHANEALRLLYCSDASEARNLATALNTTNSERQRLVETATAAALEQIGEIGDRRSLVVIGDNWLPGIIGLVANKIKDDFHRPAVAFTRLGGKIAGSGRSIEGLDIVAALRSTSDLLLSFGGHPQACGLVLRNEEALVPFIDNLERYAREHLTAEQLISKLEIDWELKLEDVTWELVEILLKLGPFGVGNPVPRYLARGVTVDGITEMGANSKHLRLIVHHTTPAQKKMVAFCYQNICPNVRIGDAVDVVFEVDQNEWNGTREIQLKVVDLRPAANNRER